jgi:N-acetylated-alpha-linked acidic dipeptidase
MRLHFSGRKTIRLSVSQYFTVQVSFMIPGLIQNAKSYPNGIFQLIIRIQQGRSRTFSRAALQEDIMSLWIFYLLAALSVSLTFSVPSGVSEDRPLLGFSKEGARQQRALESRFDSQIRKENLSQWMKLLAARPHHLGSAYGRHDAEFIASQFRSWGYDTQIEEFQVLFPTPQSRLLELVAPARYTARLQEPPLQEDSTSGLVSEQLPIYNAYSIDGDVTGKLVYVNYGVPEDYEALAERGIDVKGKIVIARYGGVAWHQAQGCG